MDRVRTLLYESVPGVTEDFKWSRPVYKSKKMFAYMKANKNNVSLGFADAHKLNDPDGLLEGTGKDMRHIKLGTMADINSRLLKEWFLAAAAD
jgi:hypothetical protein